MYWIGCCDPTPRTASPGFTNCFNPCCIGLGVATPFGRRVAYWLHVSILVVLDWVLRPTYTTADAVGRTLFQSLLYWIGCCDMPDRDHLEARLVSFNPCCIGLGVATRRRRRCWNMARVSILVVLDWVLRPPSVAPVLEVSFLFQSLLYWIGCCDEKPGGMPPPAR